MRVVEFQERQVLRRRGAPNVDAASPICICTSSALCRLTKRFREVGTLPVRGKGQRTYHRLRRLRRKIRRATWTDDVIYPACVRLRVGFFLFSISRVPGFLFFSANRFQVYLLRIPVRVVRL